MTTQDEIITRMARAIEDTPLSISSTRRSGTNGLRNADEVAHAALTAIMPEIKQMVGLLKQLDHDDFCNESLDDGECNCWKESALAALPKEWRE